jgi:hypothetical protein
MPRRRGKRELAVEGPCAGGQVGAAWVRRTDGHVSVLKWRPHFTVEELESGPVAVADRLRALGYPAPATELTAQIGHAVVLVQELLPGKKTDQLDVRHFEQVIDVHRIQANAPADRGGVPAYRLHLLDDGPGYRLHEPLRRFSRRTAALERRISECVVAMRPRNAP